MRIKIINEIWELRNKGLVITKIETKTKRERNILTQIRRELIRLGIKDILLTNRIDRQKRNLRLNQNEVIKKKDKDYRKELSIRMEEKGEW